jgi:alpha-L-fucosidase
MFKEVLAVFITCVFLPFASTAAEKLPDEVRAQQIKDLKFGMFICWSFSTFSGYEWTRGVEDVSFFKATGCDTDQWCQVAKDAGMNYILFLTKHHDGFCLWDTATTDWKVTNAPLGVDVLAKLRQSCDKYGLKLALYFSEGDWTWIEAQVPEDGIIPGSPKFGDPIWRQGENAELKKAQLEELCTQYGPIEFFWMDHAQGTGGLDHAATTEWVHRFQPNCFVGYNHGEPSGRLVLRERGTPGPIGDAAASRYNKDAEASYKGYLVAEFTYPILPPHQGGAQWFYSLPTHDTLCLPPEKIYRDYLGAVKHGNIFSLDVGPDYAGRIRDIDAKTLKQVGDWIRSGHELPPMPENLIKSAKASSIWDAHYGPECAIDADESTRWGAARNSTSGWLEVDLGEEKSVNRVVINEAGFDRTQQFELQVWRNDAWEPILSGTTIGVLDKPIGPIKGQRFRLDIQKASDVPTISVFALYE